MCRSPSGLSTSCAHGQSSNLEPILASRFPRCAKVCNLSSWRPLATRWIPGKEMSIAVFTRRTSIATSRNFMISITARFRGLFARHSMRRFGTLTTAPSICFTSMACTPMRRCATTINPGFPSFLQTPLFYFMTRKFGTVLSVSLNFGTKFLATVPTSIFYTVTASAFLAVAEIMSVRWALSLLQTKMTGLRMPFDTSFPGSAGPSRT